MSGKLHLYQFGRLSVIGANTENKEQYIMTALSSNIHTASREFRYLVTNAKVIIHNENKFAYGELIKYKRILEGDVIDEDSKQILEGGLPYGIVASSKFFLHFNSQIIAFRPIASRISNNQFKENLSKLIEKGHNEFFVSVNVSSVDEEIEISEAFSVLKKITKLFFDVHPTNPSNRPVYRTLDERLKRLDAIKEQRTIQASEKGFNVDELKKDESYMGVLLAVDGYGRASLHGEKSDGTKVVINTDDSPVTKQVIDSEIPLEIIDQLFDTFNKIWQRTRHE